jgi:hypothetical protein
MGNTGLILSGQYMTLQLLVHSILENILTNLANFLGHHNSILLKNIGFSYGNTRYMHVKLKGSFLPCRALALFHGSSKSHVSTILSMGDYCMGIVE